MEVVSSVNDLVDVLFAPPESSPKTITLNGTGSKTVQAMSYASTSVHSAVSSSQYQLVTVDTDGDGLLDSWEMQYFSTLSHSASEDYDGDGLSNLDEFSLGYNPATRDTGNTGFSDGNKDLDSDGLSDHYELYVSHSDPKDPFSLNKRMKGHTVNKDAAYLFTAQLEDSDSDVYMHLLGTATINGQLNFKIEIENPQPGVSYNIYTASEVTGPWTLCYKNAIPNTTVLLPIPTSGSGFFYTGSAMDYDGDGLPDGYEVLIGTSAMSADSDNDGYSDSWELANGYNPKQPGDVIDSDGDGLSDAEEALLGTDPHLADTNGNGISDADEDADGDLLTNGAELHRYHTDPKNAHSKSATWTDAEFMLLAHENDNSTPAPPLRLTVNRTVTPWGVTLSGTVPGITYQLLSQDNSPSAFWKVEKTFAGSESGNVTSLTVDPTGRTSISLLAGIGEDSDHDLLSDAYELFVTHTKPDSANAADSVAYADPDQDGWSNFEEYLRRTDIYHSDAPPAPSNLSFQFNPETGQLTLAWDPVQPNGGYVIQNTIQSAFGPTGPYDVGESSSSSFTTTLTPEEVLEANTYSVVAKSQDGTLRSQESEPVQITADAFWPDARWAIGPNGAPYLIIQNVRPGVSQVTVYPSSGVPLTPEYDFNPSEEAVQLPGGGEEWVYASDRIGPSSASEGTGITRNLSPGNPIIPLSPIDFPPYSYYSIALIYHDSAGHSSKKIFLPAPESVLPDVADPRGARLFPFLDGSQAIRENLKFQLMASSVNYPLAWDILGSHFSPIDSGEAWFHFQSYGYVYSGFSTYHPFYQDCCSSGYEHFDPLLPFQENAIIPNWIYSSVDSVSAPPWGTGIDHWVDHFTYFHPKYFLTLQSPRSYLY